MLNKVLDKYLDHPVDVFPVWGCSRLSLLPCLSYPTPTAALAPSGPPSWTSLQHNRCAEVLVKTGEDLHLGWRRFIGLLSQLVTAVSLAPLLRFIPPCCLWCSQEDRPGSGFRVCCEEMGHRREGAAFWAQVSEELP